MTLLSIQSRVTSGYVGNAAAVPILQRLGRTVWPIDTVSFSNHPAHGPYGGGPRPASEVQSLIDGLRERGMLGQCEAVLSGYLGQAETGQAVLSAANHVREANAGAIWCCDPVMGDHGAFYVEDGIPQFFRDRALPAADVILPNAFEAAFLSGIPVETAADAARSAAALRDRGPHTVVISGIPEDGRLGAVAANAAGCWKCMAPVIDAPAYGAGDAFSALFISRFLETGDLSPALGFAVAGVQQILQATATAKTADLALIAALPALEGLAPLPVAPVG